MLTAPQLGCVLSHRNVLRRALATKAEWVLVLEDDVELPHRFDEQLQEVMNELPANWQALWLGGRVWGPRKVHGLYMAVSRISGTYAYLAHRSIWPAMIAELSKADALADHALSRLFATHRVFKTATNLVKHKAGFSTIQNKLTDYKDLR